MILILDFVAEMCLEKFRKYSVKKVKKSSKIKLKPKN